MQKLVAFILFFSITVASFSQRPNKPNSGEIFHQIQKLNFLGSVLYIAAHPDDENTRLISYLSNNVNARTGYLSLTRGDGGQNLIGPELREFLGIIRTQELIEARKIDGGEQFFSRANDFGYSKTPDETLKIWDKDLVLSDVVWAIRKFQPDVIINRFDHRTSGTTHGHHTASALLSVVAFDKTNDINSFSNQLNKVDVWQAKRLFFNTSWWFYGSKEKFDNADKSNLSQLQTGVYYQSIGKSNQEIAALSRSCHQSQGFGNTGVRGEENEYLEFIKGDNINNKTNLFEGIDTTWNRLKNGTAIGDILKTVEKNFDYNNPSASIPQLLKAYELIQKLDNQHWKDLKTNEIKKIIESCAGLYLEAVSDTQSVSNGQKIKVKLEAINRSPISMVWSNLTTFPNLNSEFTSTTLSNNSLQNKTVEITIPTNFDYTSPYWINDNATVGMYSVDKQENIGKPDVIRTANVIFDIEINGVKIPFEKNIVYKYNDNVKGEVYQPLDIVPVITSSITEKVSVFNSNKSKTITVKVKAGKENVSGKIQLKLPKGWSYSPNEIPFSIKQKDEEQLAIFSVSPSKEESEIVIKSIVTVDNQLYDKEKIEIDYPHIYKQIVLKSAEAKAFKVNIKTNSEKIAYIMGAGDEVPKALQQMGYDVTILKPVEITNENLSKFDVVMTGVRAYNTVTELAFKQSILLDFVKKGKTMIVQYNTFGELVTPNMSPYSLKISRDRVTQEDAEVRFLEPKHSILNYPNKITENDFKNWKQEQGLYYPNEWDNNFTAIISANDTDEQPKDGAILVAKYGKGNYIYTGLSFFRELPEGVIGAFRLMANMISISK